MIKHNKHLFLFVGIILSLFLSLPLAVTAETELVPPGFRPIPLGVHALKGGKVVVKPGETLDGATILIRDGFIEKVGKDLAIPADARVWDMKGLTIYAGLIDPYLALEAKPAAKAEKKDSEDSGLTGGGIRFFGTTPQEHETEGPGSEVGLVTPERRMARTFAPDAKVLASLRELGFTTANVVPNKGIIRGTSTFVALSDEEPSHAIIKPDVFQHVSFDLENRKEDTYPESPMGAVAAVRQAFFDAQHYIIEQVYHQKHPDVHKRPAFNFNVSLEALAPATQKRMKVVFDPKDALLVDRAARIAHEMNLDFYMVSSGEEWRRPDLAKAAGVPFIVPLNYPALPKMPSDDDWSQVTLDELRAWDWAPENPAVLHNQGLEIALTTSGLTEKKDFRKNLRLAIDRGLSETNALAAMTTVPAKLCGLDNLLGTIEPGKQANFTIVNGKGYFDPESKVHSVWIDGRFYRVPGESAEEEEKEGKPAKTQEREEKVAKPTTPEGGDPNKIQPESPETGAPEKTKPKPETKPETKPEIATTEPGKSKEDKKQEEKEKKLAKMKDLQKRIAHSPLEGRGAISNPPALLIRGATIWTCGPEGRLENADFYIKGGKVEQVGTNLFAHSSVPKDTTVIKGDNLNITPGIIDCHSHSMILGDVNESTLPSTAMVRIGDVVNSETENIYLQLAGGLTVANLLHGSANPIGGQNCVIKLRDGETPEGLKFEGAMLGIKFALGENVKQANWGDKAVTRFPQTRMGVETFFANRFTAAQQYLKAWADYKKSGGLPPRRDLELEAIGEIIQGKRLIHCHSYRQDEILMLMRLMERFGVKIGTFQHVLEGYKIADEIAKHGAGGSTFSDWWAYKFEVYDAIPYNGSLMRDRGVVVSFNSDSDELARTMNLEAAKAVKYGGVPEEEALKFVTLNPAKQLHIDKNVGSLEPGKDADFVLWSKSPLSSETICLETWIEGKKYFDYSLSPARTKALSQERADLIAKAQKLAKLSDDGSGSGEGGSDDKSFFHQSLEHKYDGHVRHCLDEE
ncbi:amidohydrolase family protein [Pedosphaera parvula]|uniref:Amidohydrolase n=1 Tax=Pedosphaera parvula (strain Ellin514) TaxID=320771 RepID=B9XKC1_PEDPL|nr:amidohydrolase family protein [Pedosphaera parvula]EEF59759.1 amidohydrolase [Pedosphaera parvula Ellin514]